MAPPHGHNSYGQIGDGTSGTDRLSPVQVTGLTGVAAIAAGSDHTVALKSDGTIRSWGYNFYGQLGDDSNDDRWTPVVVLCPLKLW
jgi:alpha-tubulin suppressor-like RCC1 family protein